MGEVQVCCQLSNSACLQLDPHVYEYLFWRRIQAGFSESDSEASSKLLKIMIWCCMVHSVVRHCRWNCQCDQMHRYTAEVRGDRFIPLGLHGRPYPFCLKDDSKPCHRAKLVTNWKCKNKTRTLTLPTQSQDMSLIENLWCKISENNLGDSYMYETSDNQTQVDRVAHPSLEPVSHPRPPRSSGCPFNSDTMLKSDYTQRLAQNILTRQVNVKVTF